MKKLLFLYPIEEFLKLFRYYDVNIYEIMNQTIEERYRKKGYEINFLIYPDTKIAHMDVKEKDKVLVTDLTLEKHKIPVGTDQEGNDIFDYPSNELITTQIGEVSEIVICGFHAQDCVKRVANHFHNLGVDTLVDIELTDFFSHLSRQCMFDKATYNLANIMEYFLAREIFLYGKSSPFIKDIPNMYSEPYYKKDMFKPTITVDTILENFYKNEQSRKNKR